jgi:DNA-binding MarR family transcriptional regulator
MHLSPTQTALFNELRLTIVSLILNNNRIAEKLGVNTTDLQVLQLIEVRNKITPSQLASELGFTTGGMTVILDRLEKNKFIDRLPNPDDRRSLLIVPGSPEKRQKIADAYADTAQRTLSAISTYTDSELAAITRFLKDMREEDVAE